MLRRAAFHAGQNTGTRDILVSKLRKNERKERKKERKKEGKKAFVTEHKFLFSKAVPHNHPSEMAADAQVVKKLSAFCGTQQFSTPLHSSPLLVPIARQTNIVHSHPSYFFKNNFNIIIPSTTRSDNLSLTVMSSNKNPTCQRCKNFSKNPGVTSKFQTPE